MADDEQRYEIPVVFQIIGGAGREQAARVLHALLTNWGEGIAEVPVLDEHGALSHPVESWWFPEATLKHVDGNGRPVQHLREPNPFIDEYEGTPVMELLAEAFPESPHTENFHSAVGGLDEDAWGNAFDAFTEEALDLAIKVLHLDALEARLARAEDMRDGLADLLERTPLSDEPQREDYLVTVVPRYAGEINGTNFDRDHTGWVGDFQSAALSREQELRRLLSGAGGRSPVLPPRFQNEWLPRDLLAIQALRDLAAQEESPEPPQRLLSRDARAHLRAMLHVGDLDVQVRDDEGQSLYAGAASLAAIVLPAGVYDAVTLLGDEPARLVVGPAGRHNELASIALPRGEHDGAVLDAIACTMQAIPDEDLRARLGVVLGTVGRSGAQIMEPSTRLEQGVLLSELLRQRREQLTGDDTPGRDESAGSSRGTQPDGPAR